MGMKDDDPIEHKWVTKQIEGYKESRSAKLQHA